MSSKMVVALTNFLKEIGSEGVEASISHLRGLGLHMTSDIQPKKKKEEKDESTLIKETAEPKAVKKSEVVTMERRPWSGPDEELLMESKAFGFGWAVIAHKLERNIPAIRHRYYQIRGEGKYNLEVLEERRLSGDLEKTLRKVFSPAQLKTVARGHTESSVSAPSSTTSKSKSTAATADYANDQSSATPAPQKKPTAASAESSNDDDDDDDDTDDDQIPAASPPPPKKPKVSAAANIQNVPSTSAAPVPVSASTPKTLNLNKSISSAKSSASAAVAASASATASASSSDSDDDELLQVTAPNAYAKKHAEKLSLADKAPVAVVTYSKKKTTDLVSSPPPAAEKNPGALRPQTLPTATVPISSNAATPINTKSAEPNAAAIKEPNKKSNNKNTRKRKHVAFANQATMVNVHAADADDSEPFLSKSGL